MRTTLDIDDDVLSAAKELAAAQKSTAGQVLSDLARKALTTPTEPDGPVGPNGLILKNGWYVLPRRDGVIITNEMIDRLIEEADLEDAGIGKDG
jgi:hypothetical protein